ncbi:hypothetical protein MBLNU13_g00001t1 [Cladosporium sp. NU13]
MDRSLIDKLFHYDWAELTIWGYQLGRDQFLRNSLTAAENSSLMALFADCVSWQKEEARLMNIARMSLENEALKLVRDELALSGTQRSSDITLTFRALAWQAPTLFVDYPASR